MTQLIINVSQAVIGERFVQYLFWTGDPVWVMTLRCGHELHFYKVPKGEKPGLHSYICRECALRP